MSESKRPEDEAPELPLGDVSARPSPEVPADAPRSPLEEIRARAAGGDVAGAIGALRTLLAESSDNVAARVELGRILERRGDLDQALAEYERALQVDADSPQALAGRGSVHGSRLRYEPAEADLRRAAKLAPDDADVQLALGTLLCKSGRWREAVEPLRRVTSMEPGRASAHYYLGDACNHIDDLTGALQAFETAATLDPSSWRALKGVGIVLDRMGKPEEAAEAYRRSRAAQVGSTGSPRSEPGRAERR